MKNKLIILAAFAVLTIPTGCGLTSISLADGIIKFEANLPETGK